MVKLILAHRYLYFVLCDPVISDREYDALERALSPEQREAIGVGSSLASSYAPEIIELAQRLRSGEERSTS